MRAVDLRYRWFLLQGSNSEQTINSTSLLTMDAKIHYDESLTNNFNEWPHLMNDESITQSVSVSITNWTNPI